MLKEIIINLSDGAIRKYVFEYEKLDSSGVLYSVSNITEYGNDGTSSLAPVKFEYREVGNSSDYANWSFPSCNPIGYGDGCFTSGGVDLGMRLADLNGDGLVDVIKARDFNTSLWLNNGTGWAPANWTYDGCSPNNGNGCFTSGGTDMGARLADLNGDGLVDVIRARDLNTSLWMNNGWANYLLDKINLSLGGGISLSYQKSTSSDNTGNDQKSDLNFNIWLVSNITKNNNIVGAHNVISNSIYNFTGGAYNYTTREFRGFNFGEEKIADKITRHWFYQDDARSGKEYETEILDNQINFYKLFEKTWEYINQNGYYVIKLTQESEIDYDGNNSASPKVSNKSYSYDSFGNIIYIHTNGDIENANDDSYEYMSYITNSDKWIVNTLQNYTLFDSDNSTMLRKTNYSYDGLSYGSTPTKGSVTFKEDASFTGISKNISYQYNSFGNIVNQTDSKGNKINYSYGVSDESNTFADSVTHPKGFKTKYGYDLGTGNRFNQTDPNNFFSNFTYDFLAIDRQKVLPSDNVNYPTQEYTYSFQTIGDGKIIVKQREQNGTSNTLDTYKFYDGFGRLIQSKTESASNKQVVVDYYYDDSGRIIKQSNPYFVSATQNYTLANASVPFTLYQYDPLGRVVRVFNPDNTVKNITFDHWNITLYDENSHQTKYEIDFRGNILKIIETNGGMDYITLYEYNSAGELTFINDSLGNRFNFTYDSLGRKIIEKDPDRGLWNYSYDSEGNLIKQFDNRNISLYSVYDSLNRKLNESSGNDWVKYVYDADLNNTLSEVITNFSVVNYLNFC